MQVHRLGLQPRLQHISLELLYGEDDAEDDQRRGESVGHQRDEHRERARDEGTDDRDEATEEGDHHQHPRQGDLQDEQSRTDERGVDEADDRLRPDEAAQRVPHP